MAIIIANTKQTSLTITPLRYEYQGEDWIICKLIFKENNKVILEVASAFLQDYEIEQITQSITTLIRNERSSQHLHFTEPNFSLSLQKVDHQTVKVTAEYIITLNYEHGVLNKDNAIHVQLEATTDTLIDFSNNIMQELNNLK